MITDRERLLTAKIARLESDNSELRELVSTLRDELTGANEWSPPIELMLTMAEDTVLKCLIARDVATKAGLHAALYGTDPNGGAHDKIIDVFICKLRAKLRRAGLDDVIATRWGVGYFLTSKGRAAILGWPGRSAA